MDATTLLSLLAARETATAKDAASSRDRLAAALAAGGGLHLDHLMDEVLKAEGKAAPWRQLMNVIEDRGVSQGLAKMRQKATEHLVVYGIAMSTSLVTNAARLAELDGLRAFLSATSGMEVDEEATPEAEAPVEEAPAPAPAPAPVKAPKVTPAQKRTLEAIRGNGIKISEFRVGKATVTAEHGECPRRDMILWVIEQGWAVRDQSTSLFQGQAIGLTEIGTAILAG